jgi:hypothetical protein
MHCYSGQCKEKSKESNAEQPALVSEVEILRQHDDAPTVVDAKESRAWRHTMTHGPSTLTVNGNHKKMPTQAVLVETSEEQSSTAQRILLSATWKWLWPAFRVVGRRFSKHDRQ